jgi:hypothetical protein
VEVSTTTLQFTAAEREPHEVDWAAKVAASQRRQAALAALTPKQAAERARYYREQGKHYLRLSALKRKRGHGDCSAEMAAADRHAAVALARRAKKPAVRRANVSSGRPRAQATRSSARSGDSPDPDGPGWRWASEASWRAFVASVYSRDVERELERERLGWWSR